MLTPWEADLRTVLDAMPRRVRAELLRAHHLQPEALDEKIALWESDPQTREVGGDGPGLGRACGDAHRTGDAGAGARSLRRSPLRRGGCRLAWRDYPSKLQRHASSPR